MTDTVSTWVEGYRKAWESNEPDDIRALFTEDAVYRGLPSEDAFHGHDEIIEMWLDNADEPGETLFEWNPVVIGDKRAVVQGRTECIGKTSYHNLWVIDFADDGRASSFTEWWIEEGATT